MHPSLKIIFLGLSKITFKLDIKWNVVFINYLIKFTEIVFDLYILMF